MDIHAQAPMVYKLAALPSEFEAIHRLNYRTFVEEIPQHPPNAERRLADRFHAENTYAIVLADGELAGMIAGRCQRPFSLDLKLADLDSHLPPHRKVVEVRLLAVAPRYRKLAVFARLAGLLARHFRAQGCDLAIISGTLRELRLYRHLGFRPFGPRVGGGDAVYQPMALTLDAFQDHAMTLLAQGGAAMSLLPGPVQMRPAVARVAADAVGRTLYHRGAEVTAMLRRCALALRDLTRAPEVAIAAGSGTLANEMIAAQLSRLPGPGLVLVNGEFGARLADHARRWGLDFDVLAEPWGAAFAPARIAERLADRAGARRLRWLWAVACETSTGVATPLAELGALCRRHDVDLCLDAVSHLGLRPLDLSAARFASASSGKALGALPGLALVFHDGRLAPPGALPRALDLAAYRDADGMPYTVPGHLLATLDAALADVDWNRRFDAVAAAGGDLRRGLRAAGCELVGDDRHAMPGIVTVALPATMPAARVADGMRRRGYLLAYQSRYLAERNWLQVCLMGDWLDDMLRALPGYLARALHPRVTAEAA